MSTTHMLKHVVLETKHGDFPFRNISVRLNGDHDLLVEEREVLDRCVSALRAFPIREAVRKRRHNQRESLKVSFLRRHADVLEVEHLALASRAVVVRIRRDLKEANQREELSDPILQRCALMLQSQSNVVSQRSEASHARSSLPVRHHLNSDLSSNTPRAVLQLRSLM